MNRILLADDDRVNLRVLEAFLKPLGHELMLARDGMEAWELVQQTSPDLILLDVMMPRLDGFEVAKRIKENECTKSIPVVMVTALTDVEKRVIAYDAGADDFLTKPVDRIELLARVRSLLKVKEYHDHLRNHREHLEQEVQERTRELRLATDKIIRASLDTIFRLATASEYRDDDTGAHIRRMSSYSAMIARSMDLSNAEVENIRHAAPMHDVGKIGIPDAILLKPGELTGDEWKIMKDHTIIGRNILKDSESEIIQLAEIIALNHHERWDGSGYPNGLKGNEIPMVGRIVAVADVFDALMSDRPYKKAFAFDHSLQILQDEKGSHFDPEVMDAFFSVQEEILQICKEHL